MLQTCLSFFLLLSTKEDMTCAGKMSHNEQIFKNESFLFSQSPYKKTFKMMYDLLELTKKITELVFWRSKAKPHSNVASFPPLLFLIILLY